MSTPRVRIWFYSDPHVDHQRLVQGGDGKPPARPQFKSADELAEYFVQEHNKLVRPQDHSYCLGDFAMGKEGVERWAPRLNGHRRLILGNHDVHELKFYLQFFGKVCAMREFDGMIFTHIPIAPWSATRWRANVHGHCHNARPLFYSAANPDVEGFQEPARYINLSVENTGYRPVSLEQISQWSHQR